MNNIWHHLDQHGHVAVPLPALAGERAGELLAAVAQLMRRPTHVSALAEISEAWAPSATQRHAVTWGRAHTEPSRGGVSHLQTVASFDRYVQADPTSPELLRAVVRRLTMFGDAADRLLDRLAVPTRCTVRANVYEPDSAVPDHVDTCAVTVLFTDQPAQLLLTRADRAEPRHAVAAHGWHAIVMPGARAGRVRPGLAPSQYAVAPTATRWRSISVFAG